MPAEAAASPGAPRRRQPYGPLVPQAANPIWAQFHNARSEGCPSAAVLREKIIVGHLSLVRYVAVRMSQTLPRHVELDDLVSWGAFGLIDAVDRFDPDRGVRFESFAAPRIRGSILDAQRALDWLPKPVRAAVREVQRTRNSLAAELGIEPTDAQIAEKVDAPVALIRTIFAAEADASIQSTDKPVGPRGVNLESSTTLGDLQADKTGDDPVLSAELGLLAARMAAALSGLPPRAQHIVALRYGGRMGLREVSTHIGLGGPVVTKAYAEACLMLRELLVIHG